MDIPIIAAGADGADGALFPDTATCVDKNVRLTK